ncbi:MAG: hypothetical protein HY301_20020 [Verrucomicrobia bacterium]|nr:hypothetical protein [Verrucomicrobiota bacterium]
MISLRQQIPLLVLAGRLAATVCAATAFNSSPARAEFALRDGDTVVFLGDSITAARRYDRVIENYTLLRFPQRRVQFHNAGKGGDTMAGGLARLERDVFARGATVAVVTFGVNDIGWGMHADAEHKQRYLDSVRGLVAECKKRKVRVFICSAPVTAEDPEKSEESFLQKMCDEGLALARAAGAETIDVQRAMRAVQRRVRDLNQNVKDTAKKDSLHVADGIHLSDLGQLAMAVAILKGLGAPAEVSSVTVDAKAATVLAHDGCEISNLRATDGTLAFDRLDAGWPINFGALGALNFRYVPIPAELNGYRLAVTNLPPGRHEVLANGRGLGAFDARALARGLNISSLTTNAWEPGGPWDAQATALKMVTDARYEITGAQSYAGLFLTNHPRAGELRAESQAVVEKLDAFQRSVAKPVPIHFVIRRAPKKE